MRRTKDITIAPGDFKNRDHDKTFRITEMSCASGELWAISLLTAMGQSGVEVSDEVFSEGLAGLARFGVNGLMKIRMDLAEPLLNEMMRCVEFIPDPKKPITRPLIDDDIEEVSTRLLLRKEVLTLHLNFFTDAAPSI